jgi:hypothetical protein
MFRLPPWLSSHDTFIFYIKIALTDLFIFWSFFGIQNFCILLLIVVMQTFSLLTLVWSSLAKPYCHCLAMNQNC